jgi:hypothetical protein
VHKVFPGESDNFATGWPLQFTSFITRLSAGSLVSLLRFVPMPKAV